MDGSLGGNSTDFPLSTYSIKIFATFNCIPNLPYSRLFDGSRSSERVGKGSRYLTVGQTHPHWLQLLGFERPQSA